MTRYRATCPECINAPEGAKHCHGPCGQVKPLDEFHNDTSSPDGKLTECKECRNNKSRTYGAQKRADDPNHFYAYHKGWMAANDGRKRYAGYDAKRNAEPERREYLQNYNLYYRTTFPEKFSAYSMARRARIAGAAVVEDVERIVVADNYDWICQECFEYIYPEAPYRLEDGSWNPRYLHADHRVPISKHGDHSYANMQPMHAECNIRKNARLDLQWDDPAFYDW